MLNIKKSEDWFGGIITGYYTNYSGVFDITYKDYDINHFFKLHHLLSKKSDNYSIYELIDNNERSMLASNKFINVNKQKSVKL